MTKIACNALGELFENSDAISRAKDRDAIVASGAIKPLLALLGHKEPATHNAAARVGRLDV